MRVVIAGGGLAGLAAGEALLEAAPRGVPPEIAVLEAAERCGGGIRSETMDGNLVEHGPCDFDGNEPAARALCERLQLETIAAEPLAARTALYRGGRTRELPRSAWGTLAGGALPLRAALGALGERRVTTRSGVGETAHEFALRRYGRGAAELWMQALSSERCAGDARELEILSAFPDLVARERQAGSVGRLGPASAPLSRMTLARGMEELVRALARRLGPRVVASDAVHELTPLEKGWRLATRQGIEHADRVVLATPADETARLLRGFDEDAARALAGVPYAPLAVVHLGFFEAPGLLERTRRRGILVAPRQGVRLLSAAFPSAIFPRHAAHGWITLRLTYGGALDPAAAELADDELLALARAELRRVLGIDPEPRFKCIARAARAVPQTVRGHAQRLAALAAFEERWPSVALLGAAWRGGGVGAAIRAADELARKWMRARSPAED